MEFNRRNWGKYLLEIEADFYYDDNLGDQVTDCLCIWKPSGIYLISANPMQLATPNIQVLDLDF